jgi:hypothetical protein
MKFRTRFIALLFSLHATCSHAQEVPHTYQPANFPADQSRIIRKLSFPPADEDVFVQVFCESFLSRYGTLQRSFCASEYANADAFIATIVPRIDRSRLEPARVDGNRVSVWFQYTVQFERRSGVETIKLFPHHFVGVSGTGEGYIGPQRYRVSKKSPCRSFYDFWVTMTIPAEGGPPLEVGVEKMDGDDACESIVREIAADSDFIPGVYNGMPIPASYRERVWKVLPSRNGFGPVYR